MLCDGNAVVKFIFKRSTFAALLPSSATKEENYTTLGLMEEDRTVVKYIFLNDGPRSENSITTRLPSMSCVQARHTKVPGTKKRLRTTAIFDEWMPFRGSFTH